MWYIVYYKYHQIQAAKPSKMTGTKKPPTMHRGFRAWYDRDLFVTIQRNKSRDRKGGEQRFVIAIGLRRPFGAECPMG